ncbi:WYL domain-containing protein [Salinimicrobium sp. MT39]|uniref:WYL domain-containing protein n=1 Tax=Salinimicrobium profundisediminis TaxID=2994553 RepID=A0A9X3I1L9_9FLAO|nr:WYL domain-containing protein [Salinimicrobium profundisediminis]MCX2838598.1 WYL domain-containing protein [Salinimicrobium profundisediminis]
MSLAQTIRRYNRIISVLRIRPMSYEEVQREIGKARDALEENLLTSHRTFQRDIKNIERVYDITIASDKSTNKYSIQDDIEGMHSRRLRENFEIVNAIRLSKGFAEILLFEERKSLGTEHMAGLIHAIQNKLVVNFDYYKYWDESVSSRSVKPIALKEAKNRWYLIAEDEEQVKNFALDRMKKLIITEHRFLAIDYNVHEEFRDSFGIINGTNEAAEEVLLSFTPREGQYVQSLPLHHSQELLLKNDREMRFRYYIRPTYDFRMEILSYGDQVKVLKPQKLKEEIKSQLQQALKRY